MHTWAVHPFSVFCLKCGIYLHKVPRGDAPHCKDNCCNLRDPWKRVYNDHLATGCLGIWTCIWFSLIMWAKLELMVSHAEQHQRCSTERSSYKPMPSKGCEERQRIVERFPSQSAAGFRKGKSSTRPFHRSCECQKRPNCASWFMSLHFGQIAKSHAKAIEILALLDCQRERKFMFWGLNFHVRTHVLLHCILAAVTPERCEP